MHTAGELFTAEIERLQAEERAERDRLQAEMLDAAVQAAAEAQLQKAFAELREQILAHPEAFDFDPMVKLTLKPKPEPPADPPIIIFVIL